MQCRVMNRPESAWAPAPAFTYLADMTDEDYAVGFRYREVAVGHAPLVRVKAAVYFIDASNRIVRIDDPILNSPGYVHQCFGVSRGIKNPAWYAVQLTFPDAKMALRSWKLGKDNLPSGDLLFPFVEARLPRSDEY